MKEGRDKRRREESDGESGGRGERGDTGARCTEGGKGGRVFRRKPGGTKRLCCCPVRPAIPPAMKTVPLLSPPAPHPALTTVFSSPLLHCPLHPLIPPHTLPLSFEFTTLLRTLRFITLCTRGSRCFTLYSLAYIAACCYNEDRLECLGMLQPGVVVVLNI